MFADYHRMSTEALVDLLAQETEKLTHLLGSKEFSPEYEKTKNSICNLQAMIEWRKQQTADSNLIEFSTPQISR